MLDEGEPTTEGFYWTLRVGTKHTKHGTPEVIHVRRINNGEFFGDGFGEMELKEIGFKWQKVKDFEVDPD